MKKQYLIFSAFLLLQLSLYAQYTQVPDPNFEQALIDAGYDDILDGQFLTTNAQGVLELFFDEKHINDITGIEAFTELLSLHLFDNNLDTIDLSLLPIDMHSLFLGRNNLSTIDLSPIPNIVNLSLNTNNFTEIDASNLTQVFGLFVSNNPLVSINLTNCSNLQTISFVNTPIQNIDFSTNYSLRKVVCYDSQITSLDFTFNQNLELIECYHTPITSINLPNNPDLYQIRASNTLLTALDVTNCPALEELSIGANPLITSLDLTQNPILDDLWCAENQLTALDITQNPLLTRVVSDDNLISSIDLSNNILLDYISISSNPLTEIINPQGAENLSQLIADETNLIEVDLSLNTNLIIASFWKCSNLQFANMNNGFNETLALFIGTQCPQLSCVVVDDPLADNTNFIIDANTNLVASEEDCVLANNDFSLQKEISLYPNPTKNIFTIKNNSNFSIKTIKIYSTLGKLVLQKDDTNTSIDISHLPTGLYLVKIETDKGELVRKLVKE